MHSPTHKETEVDQLKEELIAVHDLAMARMDEIMHLKKQLQTKAESADSVSKQKVVQSIQNLEEADEAMMSWMRGFKFNLIEGSHEGHAHAGHEISTDSSAVEYLQQEKEKMEAIDQQMMAAIEEAKKCLIIK